MAHDKKPPGEARSRDGLAAKREIVLGSARKSPRRPLFIAVAAAAVLVSAGGLLFRRFTREAPAQASAGPVSTADVTHAVSLFDDGKARYFDFKAPNGITVKYFVIKSSDGVVRAAFDACDVCWPAGKGYAQQGDNMVCRNCGRRFASVSVNEVQGGCNPAPLSRRVVGDNVVLKVPDIEKGSFYFNFARRARS